MEARLEPSQTEVHGAAYTFIEVLDPHVSDNPMFSMSSLSEECETHLLPNESCEVRNSM